MDGDCDVDAGEEHLDDPAGLAEPAITVRVVEHLLVGEAGDDAGEDVGRRHVGDADRSEPQSTDLAEREYELARLGRRLETGDRALEHQLMADRILGRETHAELDELHQRLARIVGRRLRGGRLEQVLEPVDEHGVVQRELGVEVRVERRLAQVDAVGEIAQRDRGQTVATGQFPGFGHDPRPLGVVAQPPTVTGLSRDR